MIARVFYSNAKSPALKEITKPREGSWVHIEAPNSSDLKQLSEEYGLDRDLLRDGVDVNESPRVERQESITYIFTRFTLDESEKSTTAPILIIDTPKRLITISRKPFHELETFIAENKIYTSKRTQLVLQILSFINVGYKRRINQASRRVAELRAQFSRAHIENENFALFVDIEEDLTDLLFVLEPMGGVLTTLLNGRFMKLYVDDRDLIEDLQLGVAELIQLADSRLRTTRNIREAYTAIVTNNLNKIFKLLTSIAIFISLINVITGFYGMNVQLPLMHNINAVWFILSIMGLAITISYLIFRRQRWL